MSDPFDLDSAAIRRGFARAAATYDEASALQTEVRRRLLDRLHLMRDKPADVLDLGAGTGHASRDLKRRFSNARVVALDVSLPMLYRARAQQRLFRKFDRVCASAEALPLRDRSIDWCISNLMLPWCEPVDTTLAEVQRILKPGGLFAFTSFGPDTLRELRTAWLQVDDGPHVHRFIDMHDLGDALMRAGFAEPVMDVERIVLTYAEVAKLFEDLKRTGLVTASLGRQRHLGGRGLLGKLVNAYEPQRVGDRIPATFEIVYGQAWRGKDAGPPKRGGEVSIPLNRIGRRG